MSCSNDAQFAQNKRYQNNSIKRGILESGRCSQIERVCFGWISTCLRRLMNVIKIQKREFQLCFNCPLFFSFLFREFYSVLFSELNNPPEFMFCNSCLSPEISGSLPVESSVFVSRCLASIRQCKIKKIETVPSKSRKSSSIESENFLGNVQREK